MVGWRTAAGGRDGGTDGPRRRATSRREWRHFWVRGARRHGGGESGIAWHPRCNHRTNPSYPEGALRAEEAKSRAKQSSQAAKHAEQPPGPASRSRQPLAETECCRVEASMWERVAFAWYN